MSASGKFFGGLALGLGLMFALAVSAFLLNLGAPTDASGWACEILRKKEAAAAEAGSPKLLIAGGSASLFGISARELERQCGIRAVNLGSHAALGTDYLLHVARQCARPGDTVLLVLEYELYYHGRVEARWADKLFLDYLVARAPDYFWSLTPREQWNVFMLMPGDRLIRGLKQRFRRPRAPAYGGVYNPAFINRWGDQTNHPDHDKPANRSGITNVVSVLSGRLREPPAGLPVIARFCQWAREHGVRVLATYPNLADRPEYESDSARRFIASLEDFYRAQDVPVIGRYTDFIYPADDFFDTMYHLTEEAAVARTRRLASLLGCGTARAAFP